MKRSERPSNRPIISSTLVTALALTILLGLSNQAQAQSQWTTNGNNINNTNTGNVGIGTTTPAAKLAVTTNSGAVTASVTITPDGTNNYYAGNNHDALFVDGSLLAPHGTYTSAIVRLFRLRAQTGFDTLTIGRTGDMLVTPETRFAPYTLKLAPDATNSYYASTNYDILQISGTGLSNHGTYGNSTVRLMHVMNASGGDAFVLSREGNATFGGNVGVGTAAAAYRLDVQGGQINASGGLCIAGDCKTSWPQTSGGTSQWTTNGTSIYYNSGNVGVGTNAPGVKFAVGGAGSNVYNTDLWVENNIHVQGNETITQGGGRGRMRIGTAWGYMGLYAESSSTGSANDLVLGAGTGYVRVGPNLSAGAPPMNFIVPNGNIGVGTTTPGSKLFVGSGTPAVATLPGLNVALGGNSYVATSNGTINTFIGSDTSSYGIVGTLSNHPLGLRANNALAMTIMPSGNVGVGTSTPSVKLDVVGDVNASGTITGGNIVAKYQDVAEWVPVKQQMSAGTVVVLDAEQSNQVTASTHAYDTRVAGVVSAQPGVILGVAAENKAMIATTGRVKVKVDATLAPIKVGDLLVTSDLEGLAMKSVPLDLGGTPIHRPGTLIGKALEPLERGTGEILVLLSLQ